MIERRTRPPPCGRGDCWKVPVPPPRTIIFHPLSALPPTADAFVDILSGLSVLDLRRRRQILIFILPPAGTCILRGRFPLLAAQVKPLYTTSPPPFSNNLLPIPLHNDDNDWALANTQGSYWCLSMDQCAIRVESASYNLSFADSSDALTVLPYVGSNLPQSTTQTATNFLNSQSPFHVTRRHIYCYYPIAGRIPQVAEEELPN